MLHEKRASASICALTVAFIMIISSGAHASGGGAKPVKEGPIYVNFKNIVVPVIKKNGRTGVVSLSLMAEVANASDETKVNDRMPKYKDAFIRALYGSLENDRYMSKNGMLNIDSIKARLMKSAHYVNKGEENPIKDILFQNIGQQTY